MGNIISQITEKLGIAGIECPGLITHVEVKKREDKVAGINSKVHARDDLNEYMEVLMNKYESIEYLQETSKILATDELENSLLCYYTRLPTERQAIDIFKFNSYNEAAQ